MLQRALLGAPESGSVGRRWDGTGAPLAGTATGNNIGMSNVYVGL